MLHTNLIPLALIVVVGTNSLPAQEPIKTEKKPAAEAKEVFRVYAGGCTRSWKLISTHDDLEKAIEAAQKQRKAGSSWVQVTTGAEAVYAFSKPSEFKVYVRGIRCGIWRLELTTSDRAKAEKFLDPREKMLERVEIVHHYAGQ